MTTGDETALDDPASDTAGDTAMPLNPFEPGFFADPYRQYAVAREAAPVLETVFGAAVLRYDDVVRVLRDPRLSVEERHAHVPEGLRDPEIEALRAARGDDRGDHAMLNLDPPDHHRLRRLVSKVFTPASVERLEPHVRALVDTYLDAMAAADVADVIGDLAFPLPFTVISEMLGMPPGRSRTELREWSGKLVKMLDPIVSVDDVREAFDAGDAMRSFLDEAIASKRRDPDERLLSALLAAEDEGDRLSHEELVDQVVLLYIAGHETTVNLIGNGTLALLRHRDQLEALVRDPDLDANAVEELLRFDSPVQLSRRITLEDTELHGVTVPAGSFVMTGLGAANRDPRQWGETADDVDLARAGAERHVSFGGGFHHCLGAHLARLEGRVAIPSLVRRFPRIELAADELRWNGRIVLRGLVELPVHPSA